MNQNDILKRIHELDKQMKLETSVLEKEGYRIELHYDSKFNKDYLSIKK